MKNSQSQEYMVALFREDSSWLFKGVSWFWEKIFHLAGGVRTNTKVLRGEFLLGFTSH